MKLQNWLRCEKLKFNISYIYLIYFFTKIRCLSTTIIKYILQCSQKRIYYIILKIILLFEKNLEKLLIKDYNKFINSDIYAF
jgi:hypothetical protein